MAPTIRYARTARNRCRCWGSGTSAVARRAVSPAEATAFGRRDAPYLLSFDTTWDGPGRRRTLYRLDSRRLGRYAAASADGGLYLNFAGFGEEKEELVRAGYGANYDRLVELKTRYDPGNLFRMNQNIRPRA